MRERCWIKWRHLRPAFTLHPREISLEELLSRPPVRLDRTLEPGALVINAPPLGPLPFRSPGAPASPGAEAGG